MYTGDSGEMIAAAATAGIAHPTGFPIYILAGRFFLLLFPFFEPAFGVNLLSAVSAALAAGFLYLAVINIPGARRGAVPAVFLLCFSETFWSHATTARVYSPGILTLSILLFLFLRWRSTGNAKLLLVAGFTLGLGMGTHFLVILFIPAFIVSLLLMNRTERPSIQTLVTTLLLSILGATIYLYLPVRASLAPAISWDFPDDLVSLSAFVTQKEFSYKIANRSVAGTYAVLAQSARIIYSDLTVFGIVAALAGAFRLLRRSRDIFAALATIFLINLAVMVNYGNWDDLFILFRYLWPALITLMILGALGMGWFVDFLSTKLPGKGKRFEIRKLAVLPVFIPPLLLLSGNYNDQNLKLENTARIHAENILASTGEGDILLLGGDAVFGPADYYLHRLLGKHPETAVILGEFLDRDWYYKQIAKEHPSLFPPGSRSLPQGARLPALVERSIDDFRIYLTFDHPELMKKYSSIPVGPSVQLTRRERRVNLLDAITKCGEAWNRCNLTDLRPRAERSDVLISQIIASYAKSLNDYGILLSKAEMLNEAGEIFKQALEFDGNNVDALFNLGIIAEKQGEWKEASRIFRTCIALIEAAGGEPGREQFARFHLGLVCLELDETEIALEQAGKLEASGNPQADRFVQILSEKIRSRTNADLSSETVTGRRESP